MTKPSAKKGMGWRDWKLAISFARRELRSGLSGFYVFLLCLILGVTAISCVQLLSRGMVESLRHDGRYILGGDIALRTNYEPASKEQQDFLREEIGPMTLVMETRAMARNMDESKATMVELKAVDPFYPLYGELAFEDGAGKSLGKEVQNMILPPDASVDAWGAAVEKELLPRLGIKVGDYIHIGEKKFQIRGIITREPDRLSSSQFSLAPRVMISGYVFNETGLSGVGAQVNYSHRVYTPYAKTKQEVEEVQKKIADAFPDAKWRGRNFYNASPRVERTIDRLTLFLTLIGLTTLLVGGVGISNAVKGFLDDKLTSIATYKCLGASRQFAFHVYMIQILYISTLGIAIGLLFGIFAAQFSASIITEKFSLSNKAGIYGDALLLAAAFGYLSVLCFSLWPLGRAVNVPPTDLFRDLVAPSQKKPSPYIAGLIFIYAEIMAILAVITATDRFFAVWFCIGAAFAFSVFYLYAGTLKSLLKRMRPPRLPEWRMAIANLYRPGNASSSIILSLGLGLTVLSAIALVEYNFSRLLREDLAADAPSFFFLDVQKDQVDGFEKQVTAFASARNLQVTPSLRGRIKEVNGIEAEKALVDRSEEWVIRSDRGFTYTVNQPAYSRITEGEWWPADYSGPPIVSIATDVQKAFDIGVGDELTVSILGRDVTAKVANVREIEWASFTMNFAVTFAPGTLEGAPATYVSTVVLDESDEEAMQSAIAREFPNVTVVRVREALAAAEDLLGTVSLAVRASAALALIAGILVLSGGIAAARKRHIYDAVVLKVLGASRGRIMKSFLLEYGLLGAITVLIASALGTLAAWSVIVFIMDMPWKFSAGAIASVATLCLTITVAAGFFGTSRALAQKPAQHLRNK